MIMDSLLLLLLIITFGVCMYYTRGLQYHVIHISEISLIGIMDAKFADSRKQNTIYSLQTKRNIRYQDINDHGSS